MSSLGDQFSRFAIAERELSEQAGPAQRAPMTFSQAPYSPGREMLTPKQATCRRINWAPTLRHRARRASRASKD
jgi:hypothetical protein